MRRVKFPIGARMLCGFLLVIVVTGAIVVVAITRLSNLESILRELVSEEIPEVHTLWEIRSRLVELRSKLRHVVAGDGQAVQLSVITQERRAVGRSVRDYLALHRHQSTWGAGVFADLLQRHDAFDGAATRVLRFLEEGNTAAAETTFGDDVETSYHRVLESLSRLLNHEDREIERQAVFALTSGESGRRILTGLLTAGIVVSALVAFLITGALTKPITKLVRLTDGVAQGDLSSKAEIDRNDEIGHLARRFNEMLERLDRSMSDQRRFYTDASHELRTPLTIIRGEADVALRGPRSVQNYREALQHISAGADRMSVLVDELLFLGRSEAGQIEYEMRDVDLGPILREVVERGEGLAVPKDVDLTAGALPPAVISGDRQRLVQLFMNLLDNAIKYTPPGGRVRVGASVENGELVATVVDTGVGIPNEEIPYVFERFYRGETAKETRQGGTGLGLSIAHSIAKAHSGRIEMESAAGQGTTVRVVLPTARATG